MSLQCLCPLSLCTGASSYFCEQGATTVAKQHSFGEGGPLIQLFCPNVSIPLKSLVTSDKHCLAELDAELDAELGNWFPRICSAALRPQLSFWSPLQQDTQLQHQNVLRSVSLSQLLAKLRWRFSQTSK